MNNSVKNILKYLGGTLLTLLIIYLICLFIFIFATHPNRKAAKNANNVALAKTKIVKINKNYHLSRGVVSDSVLGQDKKGKKYYFVYLPKSKKAYLYSANKGLSQADVLERFNQMHPGHSQVKSNFGWYQEKPVWEVSYRKSNGNYGYAIYSFKTGRELFYVDNL